MPPDLQFQQLNGESPPPRQLPEFMKTDEFAPDYAGARTRFLSACSGADLEVGCYRNPRAGPTGAPLFADCTVIGAADADRVLIVNTGNHGVEGFCGSAALVGWIRSGMHRRVPANTRVILIHALNPYGFAWLRRVNEDNVDLNRNFLADHATSPVHPDYDRIHGALLPRYWDRNAVSEVREKLEAIAGRRGLLGMQSLVCSGQYRHVDGVFYGGGAPVWSNQVFLDIVGRHAVGAGRIVLLDFHTGLGAFGEPELICAAPPDSRLGNWFSDRTTSARLGNAAGPGLSGTIGQGLRRAVPAALVYSITVEFGTYDIYRVLMAILADNWLHARGDLDGEQGAEIKSELRTCFFPDTDAWRRGVLSAALRILDQALAGVGGE